VNYNYYKKLVKLNIKKNNNVKIYKITIGYPVSKSLLRKKIKSSLHDILVIKQTLYINNSSLILAVGI